jgi:hypothetical protein
VDDLEELLLVEEEVKIGDELIYGVRLGEQGFELLTALLLNSGECQLFADIGEEEEGHEVLPLG